LAKIKGWIDENNPGDSLIPFSVALEERLAPMSPAEREEEQKAAGATSALGKITQAGYASLDVGDVWQRERETSLTSTYSLSVISLAVRTRFVRGQSERERKPRRLLALSSMCCFRTPFTEPHLFFV
jgi:hypothetical protein